MYALDDVSVIVLIWFLVPLILPVTVGLMAKDGKKYVGKFVTYWILGATLSAFPNILGLVMGYAAFTTMAALIPIVEDKIFNRSK